MNKTTPFDFDRLKSLREFNSKKFSFIKGTVKGCMICFLTYIEGSTGENGVCNLCYSKALSNKRALEDGLPVRF